MLRKAPRSLQKVFLVHIYIVYSLLKPVTFLLRNTGYSGNRVTLPTYWIMVKRLIHADLFHKHDGRFNVLYQLCI